MHTTSAATRPLLPAALLAAFVACDSTGAAPHHPCRDGVEPGATPAVVIQFSLNMSDFSFTEQSVATLSRALDAHEAAGVPVDVYLTDAVVQMYRARAPNVVARLAASPLVAISHHVRPPTPYYPGFDWLGLASLSDEERLRLLRAYEEHRIDLVSGEVTEEPGGYALEAETFGYPPKAVGSVLGGIYREKGARFLVVHGGDHDLGDTRDGMYLRPEHVEIKLYEHVGSDPAAVIDDAIAARCTESCPAPLFVNIKMHDSDWYADAIPFKVVYYDTIDGVETPAPRPWNPDRARDEIELRPTRAQDKMWALYEGAIAHTAAHPERWRAANLCHVEAMLPSP